MHNNGSFVDIANPLSEEWSAAIERRLRAAGNPSLRHIQCECLDGLVVLRGRVPTYYVKQLAQSLVLADPAVQAIENLIEVAMPDWSCVRKRT